MLCVGCSLDESQPDIRPTGPDWRSEVGDEEQSIEGVEEDGGAEHERRRDE